MYLMRSDFPSPPVPLSSAEKVHGTIFATPHVACPPMAAHGNTASFVRIFIECHNLLDKDTFSKSDPFCCLRLKNASQPAFQEIGRTEVRKSSRHWPILTHSTKWCMIARIMFNMAVQVQMNNLNPKFVKSFDIVWQFEIRQDLEIYVYDWDSGDVRTCDVAKQVAP
jgi:hypothetical protein